MANGSEELSERELEILRLVATGATNTRIALDLGISVNTVKAHLRRIFEKLGVESRTEATTYAIQQGLIEVGVSNNVGASGYPAGQETTALRPLAAPSQVVFLVLALAALLALVLWPKPGAAVVGEANRFADLAGSGVQGDATLTPRWTRRAPMPTERSRFALAQVGTHIYVIGGMDAHGWTSIVERYSPREDLWTTCAAKPTAVANIGAAVVDGRIYVPGGYDPSGHALDVLEVYDPVNDTWSTAQALPEPLFGYAVAPYGTGFYVFGGHNGEHYVDDVYFYDVTQSHWERVGAMTNSRAFHTATTIGDLIFLAGGYDGVSEYATLESFDPAAIDADADPWRLHTPMSIKRAGHAATYADGRLYVVGGGWQEPFHHNEVYDLGHDAWSAFPSPLVGEWRTLGLATVAGQEGTSLYAIGGWSGRALDTVQVYRATFRLYAPLQ